MNMLEFALVIDVTSNVVEYPLRHTRIGEDGETILEKQGVSNKQHRLSIPAPYRKIGGLGIFNPDSVVHIPSIGRVVPQVVITVLQNGLRENGSRGGSRDHGSSRRRHCRKRAWEVEVVADDWVGRKAKDGGKSDQRRQLIKGPDVRVVGPAHLWDTRGIV